MATTQHPITPFRGATAEDLAWFSGNWRGDRGGEIVEEHWSAPAGNTLVGMFRWLRGGAVRFYELLAVEPEGEELLVRIKHFDPGLVGWEEKDQAVVFTLVKSANQEAVFLKRDSEEPLWMIYRRENETTLVVYFERQDELVKPDTIFKYTRQA